MVALKNFDIDSHYQKMRKGSLVYSFRGIVSAPIMECVFQDIEQVLTEHPYQKIVRKRIFNVLIELIQNIYKYTSSLPVTEKNMLVIVQRTTDGIEVIAGNYLERGIMQSMENRNNMINIMTPGQLDELYREILSSGMVSKQQGAGLGFIDMARKSKNELSFQFDTVSEEFSFFTVKALVKTNS